MSGRTVRIYLVDGIPSGILTAEIMNWIGKFTIAPRSQIAELASREEVKRTGVYILTGENPDDPNEEIVYIGESDNVWSRLIQHNKDETKGFWNKTVIITSKDENLTKAHVRYLESRLIHAAKKSQRAKIANGTNPENIALPESDVSDMEYFLEQIQMLLPVLGFTFSIPLPEINKDTPNNSEASPIFKMDYAGINAFAQEVNGEFIILEGSTARKSHTKSFDEYYVQIREQLVKDGKLINGKQENYWVFSQNVPFKSPSTAANIVGGASLNGRIMWKIKDKTYADWQNEQIEKAEKQIFS